MKSACKIAIRFAMFVGSTWAIWELGNSFITSNALLQYVAVLFGFTSAFVAFSYAFRHLVPSVLATLFMIIFGLVVYHEPGRTKPTPEVDREPIHAIAVTDNALSAFFMSRGGYDDFSHDRIPPPAFTNLLLKHVGASLGDVSNETSRVNVTNAIRASLEEWQNLVQPKQTPEQSERNVERYYLFHALSYAFGAAFLCAVFARRLMNLMFLFIMGLVPKCLKYAVFWGVCDEALIVARSMVEKRPIFAFLERKPFVLKRDPTHAESRLNEGSYLWAYVDPQTLQGALARFLRYYASEHYFLSSDGQANVSAADVLFRNLEKKNAKPKVFVRIDADAEEDVLFQWADRWSKRFEGKGPEIILIHEPSQVAAGLLRNYPLTMVPGVSLSIDQNGIQFLDATLPRDRIVFPPEEPRGMLPATDVRVPFRVLIVGFGAQGKALLRETVQQGVFPGTRQSIAVTVVDADAKAFEPLCSFLQKTDASIDNSNPCDPVFPAKILFHALDARSGEFWRFVESAVPKREKETPVCRMPWNRVVFALPDDLDNLRMAKRMERIYRDNDWLDDERPNRPGADSDKERPVFFAGVRRHANTNYAGAFAKTGNSSISDSSWAATFGDVEDLYRNLSANIAAFDRGAVYLNWTYNPTKNKDGTVCMYTKDEGAKRWGSTSFFDKESSRASVAGKRTLAWLLGWRITDESFANNNAATCNGCGIELPSGDDPKIDILAKVEHLRWCSFLLLRGVRPWLPEIGVDSYSKGWKDALVVEVKAKILRNKNAIESFKPTDEKPKKAFSKPNDIEEHHRHAALVPLSKLAVIDECFERGTKEAIETFVAEGFHDESQKIAIPFPVDGVDRSFVLKLTDVLDRTGWVFMKTTV